MTITFKKDLKNERNKANQFEIWYSPEKDKIIFYCWKYYDKYQVRGEASKTGCIEKYCLIKRDKNNIHYAGHWYKEMDSCCQYWKDYRFTLKERLELAKLLDTWCRQERENISISIESYREHMTKQLQADYRSLQRVLDAGLYLKALEGAYKSMLEFSLGEIDKLSRNLESNKSFNEIFESGCDLDYYYLNLGNF